jgi:transcriptional regulator with XRE-family HTH domain
VLRARLRQIRQAAEFSQRDLASRLDVPHSWVAKVESGERRLDVVELCWYLIACNQSPSNFFNEFAGQFERRGRARSSSGSRE